MYVCISKNCYTILVSLNIFHIKILLPADFKSDSNYFGIISRKKNYFFQKTTFLKNYTEKCIQYTIYSACTYACM